MREAWRKRKTVSFPQRHWMSTDSVWPWYQTSGEERVRSKKPVSDNNGQIDGRGGAITAGHVAPTLYEAASATRDRTISTPHLPLFGSCVLMYMIGEQLFLFTGRSCLHAGRVQPRSDRFRRPTRRLHRFVRAFHAILTASRASETVVPAHIRMRRGETSR
jgi:hypothetical protein